MEYGYKERGITTVYWCVDPRNQRAILFYEKQGYQRSDAPEQAFGYSEEEKKFNLKVLSKHYKIKQEQHHRAIDDTRVTALCFISMLNDLYLLEEGDYSFKDGILNDKYYFDGNGTIIVDKYGNIKFNINTQNGCISKTSLGSVKYSNSKCDSFKIIEQGYK